MDFIPFLLGIPTWKRKVGSWHTRGSNSSLRLPQHRPSRTLLQIRCQESPLMNKQTAVGPLERLQPWLDLNSLLFQNPGCSTAATALSDTFKVILSVWRKPFRTFYFFYSTHTLLGDVLALYAIKKEKPGIGRSALWF